MITNFEEETEPLTPKEIRMAEQFSRSFQKRIGPDQAITNAEIQTRYRALHQITLSGARIRKIINHIRITGMVPGLVASSKGYYMSNSPDELRRYIQSLDERIQAIVAVRHSMKKHLDSLVPEKQPTLFDK